MVRFPVKAVKSRAVTIEHTLLECGLGLAHVLGRGREPLSREGDLVIMCQPPLEQWTRPVFASA